VSCRSDHIRLSKDIHAGLLDDILPVIVTTSPRKRSMAVTQAGTSSDHSCNRIEMPTEMDVFLETVIAFAKRLKKVSVSKL
jgi:hypothetical protein